MIIDSLKRDGNDIDAAISRMANSEALFNRFILLFPNDKSMEQLTAAVQERNVEQALSASHTLKGVAGNLGLTHLYELANDMVVKIRTDKVEEAFACYDDIKKQYDAIIRIIKEG